MRHVVVLIVLCLTAFIAGMVVVEVAGRLTPGGWSNPLK